MQRRPEDFVRNTFYSLIFYTSSLDPVLFFLKVYKKPDSHFDIFKQTWTMELTETIGYFY